ncbi:MAG: hypothetical protein LBF27_28650 [Sphingobacterium sp.]|jgi:hypothetical protein|nr:hypothetical protein [Sphingobacterium sp.]
MKQDFSNAGVASKVAELLALPTAFRATEMQAMTADFVDWMDQHFDLMPHQRNQMLNMPSDFRQELARAICNCLMMDQVMQFEKDKKENEDPDFKELSVHGIEEWQEPDLTQGITPLYIRISYRPSSLF